MDTNFLNQYWEYIVALVGITVWLVRLEGAIKSTKGQLAQHEAADKEVAQAVEKIRDSHMSLLNETGKLTVAVNGIDKKVDQIYNKLFDIS